MERIVTLFILLFLISPHLLSATEKIQDSTQVSGKIILQGGVRIVSTESSSSEIIYVDNSEASEKLLQKNQLEKQKKSVSKTEIIKKKEVVKIQSKPKAFQHHLFSPKNNSDFFHIAQLGKGKAFLSTGNYSHNFKKGIIFYTSTMLLQEIVERVKIIFFKRYILHYQSFYLEQAIVRPPPFLA